MGSGEESAILAELKQLRLVVDKTAGQVDEIRTKVIPDIRGDLREGAQRMDAHGTEISDFKKWKDELTKEFWKLNGTFGVAMLILMAILHFVFK